MSTFASAIRATFGERVQAISVFGSRARGDARPDSDVDVAIVIDDLTAHEGRTVAYLAGDVLTEHALLVSAFALSTKKMRELELRDRQIARDIARDGIPI